MSSVNHGFVLFAVDLFKLAELIVDYVGFIVFLIFSLTVLVNVMSM